MAALPDAPFTVGFAAETEALEVNAQHKRAAKSIDMIAANMVGDDQGFECEDNALHVFWAQGEQRLPRADKTKLARQLIALIADQTGTGNLQGKVVRFDAKDSA